MRGGVQADAITGSLQAAGNQGADGTLTLGPGDMDDGVLILGISKLRHEGAHAAEVEVGLGELGGMFETIIYEGIEIVKGIIVGFFGVGHGCDCINLRLGIRIYDSGHCEGAKVRKRTEFRRSISVQWDSILEPDGLSISLSMGFKPPFSFGHHRK